MRVLYVNHTGRISGGELSLATLLEALPAHIKATVACPRGALTALLEGMRVEVVPIGSTDGSLRLHPTRTPRALLEMGRAAAQVRKVANAVDADLIHANSIRAGIVAAGAIGAGRRPAVVHVRDCLPDGRVSSLALRAIGRADTLIANSAYTRSTLGPGAAATRVIHNAVDLSRFDSVELTPAEGRARLGLANRRPVLAVIAQITPWKGQDDAIRIARELLDSHPDLQLLVVGSPKFDSAATRYDNSAYFESLQQLRMELGMTEAVRFLGERDDIPEILRAVDLLLVPSWEEPFGRTIVEAMAAGVPVAATEVGGPPEIVGECDAGLLLPPRQPRVWAAALHLLLDDPGRLAAMGERGARAAQQRYGAQRHAAEVVQVYESVLADVAAA